MLRLNKRCFIRMFDFMFILYLAGQYIFVDFIMKDDDVFFKETQLEMNQQVISFAIPNGHVDSPRFRLTPEVRARILWLLAGHWAAFCSLRGTQNTVTLRIMGALQSWLV